MKKKSNRIWNLFIPATVCIVLAAVIAGCTLGGHHRMYEMKCVDVIQQNHGFNTVANAEKEDEIVHNTEEYSRIYENDFLSATTNPLSTFSIDVDTASYTNTRRFLIQQNQLPPKDAVRIEEFINYFTYNYPQPEGEDPFSVTMEMGKCPWNSNHHLALIGVQGDTMKDETMPASNLVFLIDVSGSMGSANKLPLLKKAFKKLVKKMRKEDRVAIVVYASASGVVLDSTSGDEKEDIIDSLDDLEAGGSTAGGAGIKLAYKVALKNFIKNGNNRVILATDGDFNVGVSSTGDLTRLIEEKRKSGVFLTVLGFGMGNYKDGRMEQIANKGNGNYFYIDSAKEAQKVFGQDLNGTIHTIAKDVKLQVEFNPAFVKSYRLIGYENRMLKAKDFNDDKKDAGELGAGHSVTALYELIPAESSEVTENVDETTWVKNKVVDQDGLMKLKLRYKCPDEDVSKRIVTVFKEESLNQEISDNFLFASAVTQFGLILRDSKYKADSSFKSIKSLTEESKGKDPHGYRKEFLQMVEKAEALAE